MEGGYGGFEEVSAEVEGGGGGVDGYLELVAVDLDEYFDGGGWSLVFLWRGGGGITPIASRIPRSTHSFLPIV